MVVSCNKRKDIILIKKFIILFSIALFSCQLDQKNKTIIKNDSIVFKQSIPQIDTPNPTICGTAMGNIISERMEMNRDKTFPSFWLSFYQNIVDKNYSALIKKTIFPLKAKGELDYDSIDQYEKKDFKKIFSEFLTVEVLKSRQVRYDRIIEFKAAPYVAKTDSTIRIEDMVFQKIDNNWFLTLIYDGHSKY